MTIHQLIDIDIDLDRDVLTAADVLAREIEERMTDEERFSLISSLMVEVFDQTGTTGARRDPRVPAEVPRIAGWVPGVPRLGVPALLISDAGLGVTNPAGGRPGDTATAWPAGLALGASFNPALAREGGAVVGREARAKGFNVVCGGGMNLPRDPRSDRNFECLSEDPWLSAVLAAESVRGTQAQGVIAMLKHYALNVHETNKFWLDAVIDPAAHRESDLLAFQIAIERADPGAIMAAYNKVNGAHCCGSASLLNDVLKGAFDFRGFVMSDWKAVHGWTYALNGLDQQSGAQLDAREWFGEPLKAAYAEGKLAKERLADMVRRILRTMYTAGVDWHEPAPEIDRTAHDAVALEVARQGIVLLENRRALPLATGVKSVAVIGGHADVGVLAGGGSSQGTPPDGIVLEVPLDGSTPLAMLRKEMYFRSSPLVELERLLPKATVAYDPGVYPAEAAELARRSEVAVVFATKFESEGFDSPDLTLPFGQDALIEAVAAANPQTIVVLETGNPVAMPWRERVAAIVEAWYPGPAGGRAIAEVLTGAVNPSGRLPITFPVDLAQTPRPELPGFGEPYGTPLRIEYREGAEIGYRWFAKTGATPLYAFGHGLSYTSFAYRDLEVSGGDTIDAEFTVINTGARDGADVPQLYLTDAAGIRRTRLLGFERVELKRGESRRVTLSADPRLLATFEPAMWQWHIADGAHRVVLATAADAPVLAVEVALTERYFGT